MSKDIASTNQQDPIKWTWYLFLFANIIFLSGIGIAWSVLSQTSGPVSYWYISIIVCDIISILATAIFYYYETQELFYVKAHVPRKCFYFYLWSGVLYILALSFSIFMTPLVSKISPKLENITLPFALMFGVSAFLTLIAVGLYRYGKHKIELAIYRRRHGEMVKERENISKEKNKLQNMSDEEIKIKREENNDYANVSTPTSNLINNVDKESKN